MSWATRVIVGVSAAVLLAIGGYAEARAETRAPARYTLAVHAELDLTAAGTVADCRVRDPATPAHVGQGACAPMRSTVVQVVQFRQF
jgi:hypothetical protein